jgi:formylglycine-generating enzyme required for sulfatase activity
MIGRGRHSKLARWVLVGAGGAAAAIVGCATVAGLDDLEIGECKGGKCLPDADTFEIGPLVTPDTGPPPLDDSGLPCLGKQSPPSVRVGATGNSFCIDTTEVSQIQYKEFLDARIPTSSQPPFCAWNASFAPVNYEDGGFNPDEPVVGVDWCDALAYCSWAGKYLCGRFEGGKKTGPITLESSSDFRSHQWMYACSADARLRYSYGGLFDPTKCNLADFDAGRTVDVGSIPTCRGAGPVYKDIADMMGNVWEWYDFCRPDAGLEPPDSGGDGGAQSHGCYLKGGSFLDRNGGAIDCRSDVLVRRDLRQVNIGFRCCSD